MQDYNNQDCELENDTKSDINYELTTATEDILSATLKTDDTTEISESISINDNQQIHSNSLPDAKWFDEYGRKLLATSSPIMLEYHKSEIETVNKIINNIICITKCVSFATIFIVTICIFTGKDTGAIISGTTGGIIDIILSVLTGLFNSTLKSKKSYFDSEIDSSKFSTMMLLVQTISDVEKKDTIIIEILRKHFNIS